MRKQTVFAFAIPLSCIVLVLALLFTGSSEPVDPFLAEESVPVEYTHYPDMICGAVDWRTHIVVGCGKTKEAADKDLIAMIKAKRMVDEWTTPLRKTTGTIKVPG